jgi:RNA-binding protein YlmH
MDHTKYLEMYPENKEKISIFMDKVSRVKRNWEEDFTDFLNPDEQILLTRICKNEEVFLKFMGGKGYYERAVSAISCNEYNDIFPIDIVRIRGNFKFEKLSHRDYLGTILSLGIRREKIGDINVFEDGAEIWLSKEISDFICFNLTKIKHTGIRIEKISYEEARERIQNFREINTNISSMRLDCIIAAAANMSRSEALGLIKTGNVKVNYNVEDEFSRKIKEGDLLSIKGYGRYQINNIINTTKSQRLNISLKKFI